MLFNHAGRRYLDRETMALLELSDYATTGIIISNSSFDWYRQRRTIPDLVQALSLDHLHGCAEISVRGKSADLPLGDAFTVSNNKTSILHCISKIYESWYSPRQVARRYAHKIPDELSHPIVIIQGVSKRRTLSSRDPISGDLTSSSNWEKNIYNDIVSWLPVYDRLLLEAEKCNTAPSLVTFDDKPCKICSISVDHLPITTFLRAIYELIYESQVDAIRAVTSIEPAQIGRMSGYSGGAVGAVCEASGLPASPGTAVGHLQFYGTPGTSSAANPFILLSTDFYEAPDEMRANASAFLSPTGGMTSHVAVAARGSNRPCVVGVGRASVDQYNRRLIVDGYAFTERDYAVVDGSTGRVSFHRKAPDLDPKYEVGPAARALSRIAREVKVPREWTSLQSTPLMQWKYSAILQRLRETGNV